MRKLKLFTAFLVSACLSVGVVAGLCACGDDSTGKNPGPDETLYKVSYAAGEGTGTAPAEKSYAAGTVITIEQNPFTYEDHTFAGWSANGQIYTGGGNYTVPEHDTVFTATWTQNGPTLYTVGYDAGEAGENAGTPPAERSYAAGTVIEVEHNPFAYAGHFFAGWSAGGQIYEGGDEFTVPEQNTVFTATWTAEPHPAFTQESYEYDRIGGNDLELPFDLDGANFMYLELDDELVPTTYVSYDDAKHAIVVSSEYILTLEQGEYTIKAITDATDGETECTLTVIQSLTTSFDETTTKAFSYGKDAGVTFTVGYNTTHPVRLQQIREDGDDLEIDSEYWEGDATTFTVKSEWLAKNCDATQYRLFLSNNDSYTFTVTNNLLFATDYDVNTIHNTTASDVGANPLYQYYSAVEIAESPAAMNSGKALKITPNTVQNDINVHGYLTVGRVNDGEFNSDSTWYRVPFMNDKYYVVQFDYMTENTSVGEFRYGSPYTGTYFNLLLGPENDNKVHHFTCTVTNREICNSNNREGGLYLWAFFENGGGTVWVDNFRITELNELPTLTVTENYGGSGDYTDLTLESRGLIYDILIDGEKVESTLEGNALTIPEKELQGISIGSHTIAVETVFGVIVSKEFRVTDYRTAEITDKEKDYTVASGEDLVFEGNFSETLEVTSLKLVDRVYNNGYDGGWDFLHYDTGDYKEFVTLDCGLEGEGKLTLKKEFLARFWGQTDFIVEFDNGQSLEFTVNITDVLFATDYDAITMRGMLNGGINDTLVLHSNGTAPNMRFSVETRTDDKSEGEGKALFVRATDRTGEDQSIFSMLFRSDPVVDANNRLWYYIVAAQGDYLRITFDYILQGAPSYVWFHSAETPYVEGDFYGDVSRFVEGNVYFDLIADGEVHTFDSGWFRFIHNNFVNIQLPVFEEGSRFVMVDNYRIEKTAATPVTVGGSTYTLQSGTAVTVPLDGKTAKTALVDDKPIAYTAGEGNITLNADALNALSCGKHTVFVETSGGNLVGTLMIDKSGTATLTETSKDVVYGDNAEVKLAGEFTEGLKVVKIARLGELHAYDTEIYDRCKNMDPSYITVETDGLKLSRKLVDQAYRTCTYTVTFDNGKSVTFTLKSNLYWFSNYDETVLFDMRKQNLPTCQDTWMTSIEYDDKGGAHLLYRPGDAKLGHAQANDNGVFTFKSSTVPSGVGGWEDLKLPATGKVTIAFDYKIARGTTNVAFKFQVNVTIGGTQDIDVTTSYDEHGNAEGTFTFTMDTKDFANCRLYAPLSSMEDRRACSVEIDNFRIAYSAE